MVSSLGFGGALFTGSFRGSASGGGWCYGCSGEPGECSSGISLCPL